MLDAILPTWDTCLREAKAGHMYLPAHFEVKDLDVALSVMRENPFATLMTAAPDIAVSQVPVLVDVAADAIGLRLHLSSRNPQCAALLESGECVVLFTGPDCYVSPSWYAGGPNVPTWNYVSVELRCTVDALDRESLDRLVSDLSKKHEEAVGGDWDYGSVPSAFRDELLDEIAGFRLAVRSLSCKCKVSQNRVPEDRERVFRALRDSNQGRAHSVAEWMRRLGVVS